MNCAHIAATNGAINVVKELRRFKEALVVASVVQNSSSAIQNEALPIHLAVSGGHSETVRYLIDAGSSPSSENAEGMSAIHLAAKEGNVDVLVAIPSKSNLKYHSQKV